MKRVQYALYIALPLLISQSCENEEITSTIPEKNNTSLENNPKVNYLEKNPYKITSVTLTSIPEIKAFIDSKVDKNLFSKEDSEIYIDEENVMKLQDTLGNTSYSFQFKYADTPLNVTYNLIIEFSENKKPQDPYVLKYTANPDYFVSYQDSGYHPSFFTGQVEAHQLEGYFKNGLESKTDCPSHDSYGDPIPCLIADLTGASGSGGSGDSYSGPNNLPWSPYTGWSGSQSVTIIHVTPSDGAYVFGSGSVCQHPGECLVIFQVGNHQTQKSSTCPGCPSDTSTMVANIESRASYLADMMDQRIGLTDNEESYLSVHPQATDALYSYLNQNNWDAESKDLVKETVIGMIKSAVISLFPNVKYPLKKAFTYKANYPKLTEYLVNQLPKVAYISKITNAIHEFTQLPLDQIKEDLQWGVGPIVEIIQLDNYDPGKTDENTAGYFDQNTPDRILLDIDYVNLVENETSDPDALIFWIGTTVLHEYIHYGDYNNGFDYSGEEGRKFEIQVYGTNVQPDIARLVLNRIN